MNLPLHGVNETLLEPEPVEAREALEAALAADPAERGARLRAVVAAHPTFLDGWARLAELALADGDPVAAYAFARTGYHRGLDRIRKAGWGGQGPVPWHHEPNRGFLRAVYALMRAADAIGEEPEARRCRELLTELDPEDHLGVG
jgi:tetratricopeptide (TPR) repeat protein